MSWTLSSKFLQSEIKDTEPEAGYPTVMLP